MILPDENTLVTTLESKITTLQRRQRALLQALEIIATGPERYDDTPEAKKSNRDRLKAAVLIAKQALYEAEADATK